MSNKLKIMTVCGFGVGSSMILKMKIDEVLKENYIDADVFTADVGSAASIPCDIIFTSTELYKGISQKATVPVIAIKNFTNKKEIEEKGLEPIRKILNSQIM